MKKKTLISFTVILVMFTGYSFAAKTVPVQESITKIIGEWTSPKRADLLVKIYRKGSKLTIQLNYKDFFKKPQVDEYELTPNPNNELSFYYNPGLGGKRDVSYVSKTDQLFVLGYDNLDRKRSKR
jgi:hypothetical protein